MAKYTLNKLTIAIVSKQSDQYTPLVKGGMDTNEVNQIVAASFKGNTVNFNNDTDNLASMDSSAADLFTFENGPSGQSLFTIGDSERSTWNDSRSAVYMEVTETDEFGGGRSKKKYVIQGYLSNTGFDTDARGSHVEIDPNTLFYINAVTLLEGTITTNDITGSSATKWRATKTAKISAGDIKFSSCNLENVRETSEENIHDYVTSAGVKVKLNLKNSSSGESSDLTRANIVASAGVIGGSSFYDNIFDSVEENEEILINSVVTDLENRKSSASARDADNTLLAERSTSIMKALSDISHKADGSGDFSETFGEDELSSSTQSSFTFVHELLNKAARTSSDVGGTDNGRLSNNSGIPWKILCTLIDGMGDDTKEEVINATATRKRNWNDHTRGWGGEADEVFGARVMANSFPELMFKYGIAAINITFTNATTGTGKYAVALNTRSGRELRGNVEASDIGIRSLIITSRVDMYDMRSAETGIKDYIVKMFCPQLSRRYEGRSWTTIIEADLFKETLVTIILDAGSMNEEHETFSSPSFALHRFDNNVGPDDDVNQSRSQQMTYKINNAIKENHTDDDHYNPMSEMNEGDDFRSSGSIATEGFGDFI